jgi:hypothetical protein
MANLTNITIRNLRPKPQRYEIPDGNGLYVVVQPSGWKSFVVRYRYGGKTHKLTLPHGLTLREARTEAAKIMHEIDRGHNPADTKRERRVSPLERIAAKACLFIEQDREPACYLYRHYDPSGDLLYVGISLEPLRRQKRHSEKAAWRNMICQIVIEPFATREDALAAERLAIRIEFPRFNDVHNGHRHPVQELMRDAIASGLNVKFDQGIGRSSAIATPPLNESAVS